MVRVLKTSPTAAKPPYTGTVYKVWNKRTRRWYAQIRQSSGVLTLRSWAKYVVETSAGRALRQGFEVDHINGDTTNDSLDNLQVLTKAEHRAKTDAERRPLRLLELRCPGCSVVFIRPHCRTHLVKGGTATFCSRACGGRSTVIAREHPDRIINNIIREIPRPPPRKNLLTNAPTDEYLYPPIPPAPTCLDCGGSRSKTATRCKPCEMKRRVATGCLAHVNYPPVSEIESMLRECQNWSAVSRRIGVSIAGLKKHLRRSNPDEVAI